MTTTLEELKAELLRSPEVRAAYEASRPEFELAKTIIAARTAQGLTQAELAARMKTSQSYSRNGTTLSGVTSSATFTRASKASSGISTTPRGSRFSTSTPWPRQPGCCWR